MRIIDARWETDQERNYRLNKQNSKEKKANSIKWCTENEKYLLDEYMKFYQEYPKKLYDEKISLIENRNKYNKEHNENLDNLFKMINNGQNPPCDCGNGYLRKFKNSYDGHEFIGCSNWHNKEIKHTNTYYKDICDEQPIIDIGPMYLNKFKEITSNIPDNVMLSIIFETLKINNMPFLCDIDKFQFTKAVNSSNLSALQETLILPKLQSKFKKVHYQKGIMVFDGLKWKTKIPDYICFNELDYIIVYDAKKSINNLNEEQLDTYVSAVKILALKKTQSTEVVGRFIIAETQGMSDSELIEKNCLSVPMI